MADAVLFDLDRTLIDVQSFTDYAAALCDVEALIGDWDDVETPPTDWDAPTHRCMAVLVALAGDPRWRDVSAAIERHELAGVRESVAMPGLRKALAATAAIPKAVVTLLPPGAARAALSAHDVDISVVIGRNPAHRPKPAPDQLLAALAELSVRPDQAVMVGDSSWDSAAATAAGSRFIGVHNGSPDVFPSEITAVSDLAAAASHLI